MSLRQINNLEELSVFAQEVVEKIQPNANIYLTGTLGAGKTALAKKIISYKGIEEKTVKSPTYTIKRSYTSTSGPIHHLDLYRLKDINLDELTEEPGQNIIEWACRIKDYKTLTGTHIHIEINSDESRTIKFETVEV